MMMLTEEDIRGMVLESIRDILQSKKRLRECDVDGLDITDIAESVPGMASSLHSHDFSGRRILLYGRAFITGVETYDVELLDYFIRIDAPDSEKKRDTEEELNEELIELLEDGSIVDVMDIKKKVINYVSKRR